VTPVYPVNRCGVYLRDRASVEAFRDKPGFFSQVRHEDKSSMSGMMYEVIVDFVS